MANKKTIPSYKELMNLCNRYPEQISVIQDEIILSGSPKSEAAQKLFALFRKHRFNFKGDKQ